MAKKINDSKDQIRLCFHEKKQKKLLKILLLSLFIERVFIERVTRVKILIVCICDDSLADPCSIETFDNRIMLVFEMILCIISTIHRA